MFSLSITLLTGFYSLMRHLKQVTRLIRGSRFNENSFKLGSLVFYSYRASNVQERPLRARTSSRKFHTRDFFVHVRWLPYALRGLVFIRLKVYRSRNNVLACITSMRLLDSLGSWLWSRDHWRGYLRQVFSEEFGFSLKLFPKI